MACGGRGVAAFQREAQAIRRSLLVLEPQQLRRGVLFGGDAAAKAALLLADRGELAFQRLPPLTELEQRPVRVAQRLGIRAQLARGLAARFFGRRDAALDLVDAGAQVVEILLRRGGRCRAGKPREDEAAGDRGPAQPSRMGRAGLQRAFPWLATEAIARDTACWSPR